MLGKDEIAAATSAADLDSEAGGIEGWAATNDVDLEGLVYVSGQRALRAAMLLDGQDPREMPLFEMTTVRLPPQIHSLMPLLATVWADGFAAGLICGRGDIDPRGE